MTSNVIETHRLTLRRFGPGDVEDLTETLGHSDVMAFSVSGPLSCAQVSEKIQGFNDHWIKRRYGLWAVVYKAKNKVIGYCGLQHFNDIDGREEIELGYRLNRQYWGYGYATEAASVVVDFGFGILELDRIISMIDPRNFRSIRVAEKIGLHHEKDADCGGYVDRIYVIERRDTVR